MPTSSALSVLCFCLIVADVSLPIFADEIVDQTISNILSPSNHKKAIVSNDLLTSIQPKYAIAFLAKSADAWMIMVNNQPVFLVKDLANVAIAVTQLTIIMNAPDFEPNHFEPMVINGEYIGKYKDATLFRVPKSEVVNPSLNLTQWINNLRVAAMAEPLTLVEAQKQMYQLAITNEEIDGIASWYGPYFQGRQTASGEQFEQQDFTAAHKTLPFNTYLKVTNQANGKSVVVRINDRGPYFGDRNLDLSHAAAIELNSDEVGVVAVTATVLASN